MVRNVAGTVFLAAGLAVFGVPAHAATESAEIVSLLGRGEARADPQENWHDAFVRERLPTGAWVRTGPLGQMALLLADQTQLRLNQNSMVQIKRVGTDDISTQLELNAGRVWSQSKRRAPGRDPAALAPAVTVSTPNATAAIRGTDWEMEVDAEGRTRLTVLHGEVELYNAQGSVSVRDNEQAWVEKGQAPVKRLLQNPAERVQWVSAYTVEASRYAEFRKLSGEGDEGDEGRRLREIAALLADGHLPQAHERLLELTHPDNPFPLSSAVGFLLLSDFALYAGNAEQAERTLEQGGQRFPDDARLAAQSVRVALMRDDPPAARQRLRAALLRYPGAVELQLVQGELARFDGDARLAAAAYRQATLAAPEDARGWHGLGVVESEREDVKKARPHLLQALRLNPAGAATRGELATLETFASQLEAARQHYDLALQAQADDYVALTGRGLLLLKSGETRAALDDLLRASLIEPRYARAVIYTAIAYYQLGRHGVALETLARAAELDRRDPLPHLLASQMHTDLVEPGQAIDEARRALRLMPYLKSLNQLANDQKGAANLGNALAQFGLEDWALNYAQQSYSPFWAGSHLFLADRYVGRFTKQSELMQGYLTDPTAFGASNRFQTLLPRPGHYFSLSANASRSDDVRAGTPGFVANGYANREFPVAWFAEGLRTRLSPGDLGFDGHGSTLTAALGMAPREDVGVFFFASAFDVAMQTQVNPLLGSRSSGGDRRVDAGLNYKFSPDSQSWLKIGASEEDTRIDLDDRQQGRSILTRQDYRPRNHDLQYRHSLRSDADEWSWGLERARAHTPVTLLANSGNMQIRQNQSDADDSWSLYLADRRRIDEKWLLDAGVHGQYYSKKSRFSSSASLGGLDLGGSASTGRHRRQGAMPQLGLVLTPQAGEVWRLAYQQWLRPAAPATLSPVASAGIALDDQAVLPGGELQRLRLQFERELSASTFISLFADAKRIENLGEPGNVLNQGSGVTGLDRLRNRASLVFQLNGETLEQAPVFQQGRIASAGAGLSQRFGATLSGHVSYVHTASENRGAAFSGWSLPYLPRHRLTLVSTWVGPQRLVLQAQAVYRSRRHADEGHRDVLPAGWDAALKLKWQSADKQWLLEAYALNLLKKDVPATLGLNAVWRY